MSKQTKSNIKTAGVAVAGGIVGGVASNMMRSGIPWGMSENGEDINQLPTLEFETESGTVTLEDADQNGIYDAAIVEENSQNNIIDQEVDTALIAKSTGDDMSFSEAFASAREEVGPGGVFAWNGNVYGTYYKEEWDSMPDEEKDDYWTSVDQAEQENENLASTYEDDISGEAEYVTNEPEVLATNVDDENISEESSYTAEPVEMDIDENGINESILVDTDGDGIHDAIFSDTNEDGKPDLIIADTDGDGELDSYARDTDGDGKIDESGTIQAEEEAHLTSNDDFGNDYDSNADVSDMV